MDHDFTKYAAAGLILILFCLYFSGCTASDPAFSQEAAPLVQSPGAIHALKPYDQDGYYTISHLGNSTLFTYIDFSNAVTIPLCSSASCSHTSESCPTYIGVGNSSWSPLIDDLTILDENSICYPLYNAPSGITKWYTADRDGGNRQPICIHDSKLVDDHFFYFNLEIPCEGGSTPANSIFREPLNGGDAELILESDGAIWFLGGIDRWIIFFRADYESSLQQNFFTEFGYRRASCAGSLEQHDPP